MTRRGTVRGSRAAKRLSDGASAEPEVPRPWVSAHEAAVVLQMPVSEIRKLQRDGELADVRPGRRRGIAVTRLAECVEGQPLAEAILRAFAEQRLRVSTLRLDDLPPSLIEGWDALI